MESLSHSPNSGDLRDGLTLKEFFHLNSDTPMTYDEFSTCSKQTEIDSEQHTPPSRVCETKDHFSGGRDLEYKVSTETPMDREEIETSTTESLTIKKTAATTSIETLPKELHDQIIEYLMADPQEPDFEADKPSRKVTGYLPLLFVNKYFNAATLDAVKRAKDLIIVSSNYDGLPTKLFLHRIPIISDYATNIFKCDIMRLHIAYPRQDNTIRNSILIRKSELYEVAKLIRAISFELPHQTFLPRVVYRKGALHAPRKFFPRMRLTVHFQKYARKNLTIALKSSLLRSLKPANEIGKITIIGERATLISMLPGHKEEFHSLKTSNKDNFTAYQLASDAYFKKCRDVEGEDYLALSEWMMRGSDIAWECKNMDLALYRCMAATKMDLLWFADTRPLFALVNPVLKAKHRKMDICVRLRWLECQMFFGLFEGPHSAEHNLKEMRQARTDGLAFDEEESRRLDALWDQLQNRDKSLDQGIWPKLKFWTAKAIDREHEGGRSGRGRSLRKY